MLTRAWSCTSKSHRQLTRTAKDAGTTVVHAPTNCAEPLIDAAKPNVVVLDLRAVTDLEYTALKMLSEAEKKQREQGVSLWLVGMNPEVLAVVQRSPLGKTLGHEAMHFNLETAVARYLSVPATASINDGDTAGAR